MERKHFLYQSIILRTLLHRIRLVKFKLSIEPSLTHSIITQNFGHRLRKLNFGL